MTKYDCNRTNSTMLAEMKAELKSPISGMVPLTVPNFRDEVRFLRRSQFRVSTIRVSSALGVVSFARQFLKLVFSVLFCASDIHASVELGVFFQLPLIL